MAADELSLEIARAADLDGSDVPVVTSLSSTIRREFDGRDIGHTYQFACLETWLACGFRVISVNTKAEVPYVRAMYPDVEIALVERDMTDVCGRPLVPLSEMVRVLAETGAGFGGVVQSDVFVPRCDLAAWLSKPQAHDLLFMRRREIDHPMLQNGPVRQDGFDAVFFDTRKAAAFSLDPFTIGLPWWNCVLPMAFLLARHDVAEIEGLPLLHFSHRQGQTLDEAVWVRMFEAFRERFAPGIAGLAMGGDDADALIALMFEDRMAKFYAERGRLKKGSGWNAEAAGRYRRAYAESVVGLITQKSGTVVYDGGERRWR